MSDSVYITGELIGETTRAVWLLWDIDEKPEWLPKSQIIDRQDNRNGTHTLELPAWLAEERGIE